MTLAPTLGTGVSSLPPEGALAALGRPGGGSACALCQTDGGLLVWRGDKLRVIRADEEAEKGFPAFYRVVWNGHAAEFSDLSPPERQHCMEAVAVVEQALREQLAPTKINLAALGNMVPHLHWHVLARFDWDSHFPAPVWAAAQRARDLQREQAVRARLPALEDLLRARLSNLAPSAS